MSGVAYALVKTLHVLAAATLLGSLALLPLARHVVRRHGDRPFSRLALRLLDESATRLALPGVVAVFLTGILLVVGPFGRWEVFTPEGHWILLGLAVWLAVAAATGLAAGSLRHVRGEREARPGEPGSLWRHHGRAALAALAAALVAEAVMVFQPAF